MKIIPAIDIRGKKVVRLERGMFDREKVYSDDPVRFAQKWKDEGAELLHLVDLDGAKIGRPVNLDILKKIKENVKIEIELGGGLRTEENIEEAFSSGADFAVIGTSAAGDYNFCKNLLSKFKEKIIFAVDVKDGKVAIKGWEETVDKGALEYVKELENLGATRIIYTDISRDGMMNGPNLDSLKKILEETSLMVTASGGISNIEDIKLLKTLGKRIDSAIVGRALYEGKIDLKEAIDVG